MNYLAKEIALSNQFLGYNGVVRQLVRVMPITSEISLTERQGAGQWRPRRQNETGREGSWPVGF
jgi:hypothetical protein